MDRPSVNELVENFHAEAKKECYSEPRFPHLAPSDPLYSATMDKYNAKLAECFGIDYELKKAEKEKLYRHAQKDKAIKELKERIEALRKEAKELHYALMVGDPRHIEFRAKYLIHEILS